MHLNRQSNTVFLMGLIFIINISIFLKAQSFDNDDASVYVPSQSELSPGWTINQQSRVFIKGYCPPERFKKFQQIWQQQGRQIESQISSLPKQQRQMFEMIKGIAEKLEDMEGRANDIKSQFHYQLHIKTGEKVTVYNRSIDAVFLMAVNAMVISTASNASDWWEFYSDLNREQMGNAAEMMKSLAPGFNPDFAVNSLSGWGDEALEVRFGFDVDESRLSPAERNQIAAMKSQMAAVDTYGMVVRVGRVVFQVITAGAGRMQTKQRVTREMMGLILKRKKVAMEESDTGAGERPLSPIIIALLAAIGLGGAVYGGAKLVKFFTSHASASKAKPKPRPKSSASSPAPGPQLEFDIPDMAEPPPQSVPSLQFEEPVEPMEPLPPPGPSLHFEDIQPSELLQEVPGSREIEKERKKEREEEEEQKEPVHLILSSSVQEIESNGKDQVELTAQVLDRDSLPLAGQAVDFETLDGGTLTPIGTATGPGGKVKAMWLPESNTRGNCRLGAFCRDYPNIHERIFVRVNLIQPVSIKLTAAPDRLPADGKSQTKILPVVTGKNGEPIHDAYVEFSTDQPKSRKDLQRRSDRTGADGTANNQFTVDEDVQGDSVEITAAIKFFDSKKLHPPLEGRCKVTVTTNLVEGENIGQLDRETTSTDPDGIALFKYTASETGGEFNIRVWPESRPSLEKVGTLKQEAFPYFDVDFADRIIRVYLKEEAEARTRGLATADLEKVRVLRTDREIPFPGTIGIDRFLVAAVHATFGY